MRRKHSWTITVRPSQPDRGADRAPAADHRLYSKLLGNIERYLHDRGFEPEAQQLKQDLARVTGKQGSAVQNRLSPRPRFRLPACGADS